MKRNFLGTEKSQTAQTTGTSPRRRRKLGRVFFLAVYLLCGIAALLILSRHAWAATYPVTTNGDKEDPNDGFLSLREAILLANENPGKDTITFDINNDLFGPPPHTIFVGSADDPAGEALPGIDDPVIIDGTSEPDYALQGKPVVVLDGSAVVTGVGLFVQVGGAGSEFLGLVIKNFPGSGILLYDDNNVIRENYIGTDASGTIAAGNGGNGISISVENDNQITDNVISGNKGWGIFVSGDKYGDGSRNQILGNFIGADVNGTGNLGNALDGVFIYGGDENVIKGNVISNNGGSGVVINAYYATANKVQGNFIGTNKAGTPLPNAGHGVHLAGGSRFNTIGGFIFRVGGTINYAANIIAFNKGNGVFVESFIDPGLGKYEAIGNAIRGNAIFNNAGLGIDLAPAGVTPNDFGDADSGPNNLQNYPILISAFGTLNGTIVNGHLSSKPSTSFRVDFYVNDQMDPSGYGEGQKFLKSLSLTTNSVGLISFTVTLPAVKLGKFITATATDTVQNTSEFSNAVVVSLPASPQAKQAPAATRLGVAYPNPSNPDTWIPYQLKEPASVTIRIYDTKGRLVRTLDLGDRAPGFYTSRAHAAYWDGKNDAGEKVASGIYFYQLQAGEFSATRRMVLLK